MRFFNREKEIEKLQEIQQKSLEHAQMTVVTGRRRIGKTQLLLKATEEQTTLYFFVAKKAEALLCDDFQREVSVKLGIPLLGQVSSFAALFDFLMKLSADRAFNLIIDEFQEFFSVNSSVYSDMQRIWDLNKDKSKMNLLVSGSVFSLMHKIFEGSKESLFGRATNKMQVRPFRTDTLKEILNEYHPAYTKEDLLALYAFTGGVAKYVQLFIDNKAYTCNKMIRFMIQEDSIFLNEGRNMLIEEFGKEYTIYFSILSSIARGENTRAKIEAVVEKEIGGYLTKLERDYGLIKKITPVYAKVETKNVRYEVADNFLTFWFRFIYKYGYVIEIGAYDDLQELIKRDYPTYTGKILERYFNEKYMEEKRFSRLGGFWDRKGHNEIDLIAVSEIRKKILFAEIKRNAANIDMKLLKEKADYFLRATGGLSDYEIDYAGLSMEDM
ncbi:MAG: ATP-binding protein [Bacteroidales bacterium]